MKTELLTSLVKTQDEIITLQASQITTLKHVIIALFLFGLVFFLALSIFILSRKPEIED
ncbi:hypothetical protein [Sphingobacterium sp. UGAL515B_05]|jgi:hypothetical protein|uniref:hypothetical protein n=1 Tax=Sphingobacterium sp. UGAL515B_05 TaxID=2986767 RepID=UPI0029553AA1|nr:hypothetical protein [Sphingobacterium sp. UGAL515B_05]WON93871.1 hypothetical protein OK025_21800 [Sphingobacterium sp. UGAL515B_05]